MSEEQTKPKTLEQRTEDCLYAALQTLAGRELLACIDAYTKYGKKTGFVSGKPDLTSFNLGKQDVSCWLTERQTKAKERLIR